MDDELEGQDRVIAVVRKLVDRWRGFPLGTASDAYPDKDPLYEPQAEGEHALTETSRVLLTHWFRAEPHELGRPPNAWTFKYWPHQRRAVETFIYMHEVRRIRRTEQLWELCGVEPLGTQRDPWAKLGAQLATGSGKTKVMSLIVAWSYLNATVDPKNALGFGKHALIVAPGLFVRDRLLADFKPPGRDPRASVFFTDPVVPPELESSWDVSVYDPSTCPHRLDPSRGALVVTNYHQLLRASERPSIPIGISRDQLGIDLLFGSGDPSKLEALDSPLLERFDATRGLLVINDEAHHVGDEPAHAEFEQRTKDKGAAEAMAWIRSIRRLHGSRAGAGRLALQVDMSATLFEEVGMAKKPSRQKGKPDARALRPADLFRHTAVRYDLPQAIRDGIVKKPILERITVKSGDEPDEVVRQGQPNAWEKYRNLIITGIKRWKQVRSQLLEEGDPRKPIMFLLCENQEEAKEIANYLRHGDASREDLSNRPVTGCPDPDGGESLFVEPADDGTPESTVVEIHIGKKEETDEEAWSRIRQIVNEIDRDELLGDDGVSRPNRYNVVVSVMMLKEGWDVRNVKVIVPLRPCDSRTLTEQILGRGLRKMHAPIIEEDGAAQMRGEELYVMEHPSFQAILQQVGDILEQKDSDQIGHAPDYIGIPPKDEPERDLYDLRLVRFEGFVRVAASWYDSFRLARVPALSPRQAWLGEIPEVEIQTYLVEALAGGMKDGQSFRFTETWSYRDLDQLLDRVYVEPLLREMRVPYAHKTAVRAVAREYLEQRTFAVPAGLPLSFAAIPDEASGRLILGNLARPDVFRMVRAALGPVLRQAIGEGQQSAEVPQLTERRARDLIAYQAIRRNVMDPAKKTVFQRAATDSAPEERLARALDRATDVVSWLYNHRQGVGFTIQYDHRARSHFYYPDFIVRASLGLVPHNFIIEVKGRFDDRDRKKALQGRRYAELLSAHDREPWHYLVLVENQPEGRADLDWWSKQAVLRIEDLLRHHETIPLFPEEKPGSSKVNIVPSVDESQQYSQAVPVLELDITAGAFPAARVAEPRAWAVFKTGRVLDDRMFVAKVHGKSMEPKVPEGCLGLFRRLDEAAAANAAMNLRRVLVELRGQREGEDEGRYVLKRLVVARRNDEGGIEEIELRSDNPSFKPITVRPDDGDLHVRAELLEVVG